MIVQDELPEAFWYGNSHSLYSWKDGRLLYLCAGCVDWHFSDYRYQPDKRRELTTHDWGNMWARDSNTEWRALVRAVMPTSARQQLFGSGGQDVSG